MTASKISAIFCFGMKLIGVVGPQTHSDLPVQLATLYQVKISLLLHSAEVYNPVSTMKSCKGRKIF